LESGAWAAGRNDAGRPGASAWGGLNQTGRGERLVALEVGGSTRLSGELAYFDTSAIVKLIKEEEETEAISAALTEWPDLVSADLLDGRPRRRGLRI